MCKEDESNRIRKKLDGFNAKMHGIPIQEFPVYLIGQLARDSRYTNSDLSGSELLQCAIDVIASAVFVMHNSSKAWMKTPDGRKEFPEYPERAVQEGIVNALIHRNYLELGSEVHIDMFDDRIEIYSVVLSIWNAVAVVLRKS